MSVKAVRMNTSLFWQSWHLISFHILFLSCFLFSLSLLLMAWWEGEGGGGHLIMLIQRHNEKQNVDLSLIAELLMRMEKVKVKSAYAAASTALSRSCLRVFSFPSHVVFMLVTCFSRLPISSDFSRHRALSCLLTHTHTQRNTHKYPHTHTHRNTHKCPHTHTHTCMYLCTNTYTHACTHTSERYRRAQWHLESELSTCDKCSPFASIISGFRMCEDKAKHDISLCDFDDPQIKLTPCCMVPKNLYQACCSITYFNGSKRIGSVFFFVLTSIMLRSYYVHTWCMLVQTKLCETVCWLLNVPATCECISGTDLLRQFYVLPHWDRSCRSKHPSHPVTVYWCRANQSQCLAPGRVATGVPIFKSLEWLNPGKIPVQARFEPGIFYSWGRYLNH